MKRSTVAIAAALLAARGAEAGRRRYNTTSRRIDAPGIINVHLIPHTHDDVGWLKTPSEYYYGSHQPVQHAGVQYIISTVVDELLKNPDRKFIYVEQAFFQMWWAEQDEDVQAKVQQLVANGQLEFVNGGWTMHDEANPVYTDMVDQTTLGHREIKSIFGGSMMASPLSGFSAMYFGRIDYSDMQNRRNTKSMEMMWSPSASVGLAGTTFGGVLDNLYFPPAIIPSSPSGGMCWDIVNCNDDPVMDDPRLEDYNVPKLVDAVVAYAKKQAGQYVGGDIQFNMGFDFNYEGAQEWFINLDKIIHYVNLNTSVHGVNLIYSTPSIYTDAKLAYPYAWPVKVEDDFFPLLDGPHSSWAGYFTSRAALKGYIRQSGFLFQAAKQLQAFTGGATDMGPTNPLYALERAMGVTQHHDAVAGTEQQHVALDYARQLATGRASAYPLLSSAFTALTGYAPATGWVTCDLANATICPGPAEAGAPTLIAIYNSQSQARPAAPVRVPVGLPAGVASYAVADPSGSPVTAQLLPLSDEDAHLRTEYYGYPSGTPVQWLAFTAASLPPAGYAVYFLTPAAAAADAPATHASTVVRMALPGGGLRGAGAAGDQTLTNGLLTLTLSGSTGLVSRFQHPAAGVDVPLAQQFLWYNASAGNAQDGQASGAYIFRPNGTAALPLAANAAAVTLVTGPVVSEARQVVATAAVGALPGPVAWASQVIRLWANATSTELEWTVGPIPFADGLGKEVVSRFTLGGMATNGSWAADSNGRDMVPRVRNYRKYFNYTDSEPVAGNYYPVNAAIETRDVNTGLTMAVVTDRSQGGSSMADGSLELMVHRRLAHDDNRGVAEPLNETGLDGNGLIVRGTHRLLINPAASSAAARRAAMQDVALYAPVTVFAGFTGTPAAWLGAGHKATFSGLAAPLPANAHLVTLHSWGPAQTLVRLAHLFGAGEDAALSANVTVSLGGLFPSLGLKRCSETTLTANQPLADVPRTTYRGLTEANAPVEVTLPALPEPPAGDAMDVTLTPMAIRTFLCSPQ